MIVDDGKVNSESISELVRGRPPSRRMIAANRGIGFPSTFVPRARNTGLLQLVGLSETASPTATKMAKSKQIASVERSFAKEFFAIVYVGSVPITWESANIETS